MIQGFLDKLLGSDDKPKAGAPKNIKHGRDQISELLTRYQQQDHLLTAVIMDNERRRLTKYHTGVVMVDGERQRFTTDEFQPEVSAETLQPGIIVQFSLTHNGVRHQFQSHYQMQDTSGDHPGHQFEFPKGIEQVQLRDAFRVKLSQAHPIKVTLSHPENPPLTGTLADLSATGLRLRINGMPKLRPVRGEIYSSCHLVLSDGQPVVCGARLMHWEHDPQLRVSFLGLQFEELDGNTQRALNRYLTTLQRKQRSLT
ncbi:MAG: hypothetical protein CML06_16550 [Pseudomonadales bacterium]|nr:hypothetical protein [Pseudomonadales bacterium]